MNQPDQTPGAVPVPRPPKPYTTPALTIFGELARLARGSVGPRKDADGHPRP
jgi:hypothetical protein